LKRAEVGEQGVRSGITKFMDFATPALQEAVVLSFLAGRDNPPPPKPCPARPAPLHPTYPTPIVVLSSLN